MEKITAGEAHLITLDGGDIYHAGSVFGMKPIMAEHYDYGKYKALVTIEFCGIRSYQTQIK